MPFSLSDATSNTQSLATSNSGAVALGPGMPSSGLSVAGRQLFNGSTLTASSVPSNGLNRITGSVLLTSQDVTTVTVGPCAGLGIMPGAFILSFTSTTFDAAYKATAPGLTQSFSYSVI